MPYIAFLDMLGSKNAALISSENYTEAIEDFNDTLSQISDMHKNCRIYGYSDNAYIQIDKLDDMIECFQELRNQLLLKHRYFTAAVDEGELNSSTTYFGKGKGSSMKFTDSRVIDIYLAQSQFSGIGFYLSPKVVTQLKSQSKSKLFCPSIYQPNFDNEALQLKSVMDIAYEKVSMQQLSFIIADYITTTILNKRAGRYYITPIISMIKCLNENIIENDDSLNSIISLITFQQLPEYFKNEGNNQRYAILFLYALIDFILSLDGTCYDIRRICKDTIKRCNISTNLLIDELAKIPIEIISYANKNKLISILYNLEL